MMPRPNALLFSCLFMVSLFAAPENWPTNPYWVHSSPPNGPGHKIQVEGLLAKVDKQNLGIKVNIDKPESGFLGIHEVGDELTWRVVMGDMKSRLSLNHKGGAGSFSARLFWNDDDGKTVMQTAQIDPGCG